MGGEPVRPRQLGDILTARRRSLFVGRVAEQELVASAVEADEPPFAVLHIHGPGGAGKSALLRRISELAGRAGRSVHFVDGHDSLTDPMAVLDALRRLAERDPDEAVAHPAFVLVDAYERLPGLDGPLRTDLLPRLPAGTITVLAGRHPPTRGWLDDPAWSELLRVVSLRNLRRDDCVEYLRRRAVPAEQHEVLIGTSFGHPLALSLLVDVLKRDGDVAVEPLAPDLVHQLVRRFVDTVPDDAQRIALAACALARTTTSSLLRDVGGPMRGDELFAWLHELSFVDAERDGLVPHELARATLDAELRWRDPQLHATVLRAVRDHVCGMLDDVGRARRRAVLDLKFLFRRISGIESPVDWSTWGSGELHRARVGERASLHRLVAAAEGDVAAGILARWLDEQPEGAIVLDDDQGVRGLVVLLDLTAATPATVSTDPVAAAAWRYVHDAAPPRPGEAVTLTRFVVDRDAYQDPSPTLNAVPVLTLERYLDRRDIAWDLLALAEPDRWDEYFAMADLHRADGADAMVGGRRFGLFGHDFRVTPVGQLVALWTERAVAGDASAVVDLPDAELLVLSHDDFQDAVRQALRDLHRHDRLARNPLLRTRLLADVSDDAPDATVLAQVVSDGVDVLRHDVRDEDRLRAVEVTYLASVPNQRVAAGRLGLPFSTYRRHLTQGVERVVEALWDREVHGGA